MIDLEDALLMRAEHCAGYSEPPEYEGMFSAAIGEISRQAGKIYFYSSNADKAMWQSLLTREVLLTGGL